MRLILIVSLCFFLIGCGQTQSITSTLYPTDPQSSSSSSTSTTSTMSKEVYLQTFIDAFSLPTQTNSSLVWVVESQGVQISYLSHNTLLLEQDGTVHSGLYNETVSVTLTFTYQDLSQTKTYTILILARKWSEVDIIEQDFLSLTLPTTIVDQNLTLPKSGPNGSLIVWKSSSPHIVSHQGVYYPPVDQETITLTATLLYEGLERVKTFTLEVKPIPNETKVQMAALMIQLPRSVEANLILPSRGYYGVQISWSSSHPEILSAEGIFKAPIGTVEVTLEATFTLQESTHHQTFVLQAVGHDPQAFLDQAFQQLAINHGITVLFESLTLPTQMLEHVQIEWTSTHPDILSETGVFQIPENTTTVILQASLQILNLSLTKEFSYLVIGSTDRVSEEIDQQLPSVTLNLDFPVWLESKEALSKGTYDQIMMKDHRLVLQGDALNGSYTSPWLMTDEFIRLNVMWSSITHPQARTAMEIRTTDGNTISPWIALGDWGYGGENQPPQITHNVTGSALGVQYRILFTRTTATIPSPRLHSVTINFVYEQPKFNYDLTTYPQKILYDVPQLRQADTLDASLWNNICWGTSISMMLVYYQELTHLAIPQEYYAPLIRLGTTRYGTVKNDIGASQFEMDVLEVEFHSLSMLLYALQHYGPVIVGVSQGSSPDGKFGPLTFTSGHVIVVVGYEIQPNGDIILAVNDPAVSWIREVFYGPSDEFMKVWDKGGIIVQPHS